MQYTGHTYQTALHGNIKSRADSAVLAKLLFKGVLTASGARAPALP